MEKEILTGSKRYSIGWDITSPHMESLYTTKIHIFSNNRVMYTRSPLLLSFHSANLSLSLSPPQHIMVLFKLALYIYKYIDHTNQVADKNLKNHFTKREKKRKSTPKTKQKTHKPKLHNARTAAGFSLLPDRRRTGFVLSCQQARREKRRNKPSYQCHRHLQHWTMGSTKYNQYTSPSFFLDSIFFGSWQRGKKKVFQS